MDLASFIPYYPETPTTENITKRLEFNRNWSNPEKDREFAKVIRPGQFFKNQKITAAYMLAYDRLLLFARPGTGKTRSYIHAAELLKRAHLEGRSNIKRVIILTNLKPDVTSQIEDSTGRNKKGNFNGEYEIYGYIEFMNILTNSPDRTYHDTFFIIDEAHELKSANSEELERRLRDATDKDREKLEDELKKTTKLTRVFEDSTGIKICVATATPVFDRPEDVLALFNFMLPKGGKLLASDLYDDPSTDGKGGTSRTAYEKIRAKVGNMISYVGELDTGAEIAFRQSDSKTLDIIPHLYEVVLTKTQTDKLDAIPNKSFGINNSERIKIEFADGDFSPKCDAILRIVNRPESGSCFSFTTKQKEGIIEPLEKRLKAVGYTKWDSSVFPSTPGKRYMVYTSVSVKKRAEILKIHSDPRNKNGEYIKILIASEAGTQGINISNIKTVICMAGDWNFSETYQGIYRAIRATSHIELLKEGNITVEVYLLCAVREDGQDTQDIAMYRASYRKDREIKRIDRILKRLAFDCNINYPRNYTPGVDGSRDCDYTTCSYVCDWQPDTAVPKGRLGAYDNSDIVKKLIGDGLIVSEFDLLFSDDYVEYIAGEIQTMVSNGPVSIVDLYEFYGRKNIGEFIVNSAIDIIVKNKYEAVTDKFGFYNYIVIDSFDRLVCVPKNENLAPKRFNTDFWSRNMVISKIEPLKSEQSVQKQLKEELAKMISGGEADDIINDYNAYWFAIKRADYDRIKREVDTKERGAPSAGGIPTDKKILKKLSASPVNVIPKDKIKSDDIIFTNIFLLDLLDVAKTKSGDIAKYNKSYINEETPEVEFYEENTWRTEPTKSKILRCIIENFNENRLIDYYNNHKLKPVSGDKPEGFFSLYPDDILRYHFFDKRRQTMSPGMAVKTLGDFIDLMGVSPEVANGWRTIQIFKQYLITNRKIFIYDNLVQLV
jgi:hypothetical protein